MIIDIKEHCHGRIVDAIFYIVNISQTLPYE